MTWREFWARFGLAVVLTPVAHWVPLLWGGNPLHWVAAIVVALLFVFVGELLVDALMGDL